MSKKQFAPEDIFGLKKKSRLNEMKLLKIVVPELSLNKYSRIDTANRPSRFIHVTDQHTTRHGIMTRGLADS
ncbi:hypothetical protein BOTNAR_0524g00010 [Botryotinia narcissicola]|uniref:Uncharacterized protein n=1 Tax=Botryotinia narcissicola TaxID=278944 RepID=A0A4Z1HEQ5_9HELO|nr:hypothetical protein BOTNAR_0524g00010 [Botryotinia narcissicola]